MLPAFASVRRGDLDLWLAGPAQLRRARDAGRPSARSRVAGTGSWSRSTTLPRWSTRLRAAGATFRNDVVKGPGGKQILVDDPDGNPIELFEARR